MKKLILSFSLMFFTSSIHAFENGTYRCVGKAMFVPIDTTFILKPNGRAKEISKYETKRGYWQDDDDAALIIQEDTVLEDKGNGKYVLNQFKLPLKN